MQIPEYISEHESSWRDVAATWLVAAFVVGLVSLGGTVFGNQNQHVAKAEPPIMATYIAISMVVVSVALVMWFQRYLAATSARRMIRMMMGVGLNPGAAMHSDPRTEAIMKEAQCRCRNCMAEDLCDRWLVGKVEGDNSFCPNARTFGVLKTTVVGRTN